MNASLIALLLLGTPTLPGEGTPVSAIVVRSDRTEEEVIRRELQTRVGGTFSSPQWEADTKRLKDMGIFWSVDTTAETARDGSVLYLDIRDKWTLIPRLRFATTSDVLEWQVGLYDANLLGKYVEVGAQVEQKAGAYGFMLWNYNWRIRNTDYYYKLEVGQRRLFHPVFDQNRDGDQLSAVYDTGEKAGLLELGTRVDESGVNLVGIVLEPTHSRYSLSGATDGHREANAGTDFAAPMSRTLTRVGAHIEWGRPLEDDYVFDGWGTDSYAMLGFDNNRSTPYFETTFEYKWLTTVRGRDNAGFRLYVGRTSSTAIEDAFTMGGLNELRGFVDERFHGRNIWYANAEYRLALVDTRWLFGQPTLLVDAGRAWDGSFASADLYRRTAVSAGVGVRGRIKPMFNTHLRVDYAWGLLPYRSEGLSVGIYQFF